MYDQITAHIRGLEALEVIADQYRSLLIPIIMSKLPSEVRLRIARESKGEVWKVKDLMKVLLTEVELGKLLIPLGSGQQHKFQPEVNHIADIIILQEPLYLKIVRLNACSVMNYIWALNGTIAITKSRAP